MPFWSKKKPANTAESEEASAKAEGDSPAPDVNRTGLPPGRATAGSVDFGDGAANAPSIVGVCQPVGGAVEAVAACYWRLVPGKKGAPKYHIDF